MKNVIDINLPNSKGLTAADYYAKKGNANVLIKHIINPEFKLEMRDADDIDTLDNILICLRGAVDNLAEFPGRAIYDLLNGGLDSRGIDEIANRGFPMLFIVYLNTRDVALIHRFVKKFPCIILMMQYFKYYNELSESMCYIFSRLLAFDS